MTRKETKESTWDEEQLEGIARQLEKHLSEITGLKDIHLSVWVEFSGRWGEEILKVDSNDFAAEMHPKMFSHLSIINFGGNWARDEKIVEHYGMSIYWLPLNYSYEHFGRGHNGSEVATAMITEYGEVAEFTNKLKENA